MADTKKIVLTTAIVGLSIAGVAMLAKTSMDVKTMIDSFNFQLSLSKFKASKDGISITADVNVVNPSDFKIKVQKPYVEVYWNEPDAKPSLIASSMPSNEMCPINPTTVSPISGIQLNIPFTSFIATASKVLKILFTDVDFSNMSWDNLVHIAAVVNKNVDKIYPYISIRVVTKVLNVPINKTFNLE